MVLLVKGTAAAELAALVPDEIVDALHIAFAQDQRKARVAADPRDVHSARYRLERAHASVAWERVGELVADWLCSSSDPVVPIDEARVDAMSRVAVAPSVPKSKTAKLRLVRTGRA
jgi:hypothetical protein